MPKGCYSSRLRAHVPPGVQDLKHLDPALSLLCTAAAGDRAMASPATSFFSFSLWIFLFLAVSPGNVQPVRGSLQWVQLQTHTGSFYGAKATMGVHSLPTVPFGSWSAACIEVVFGDPVINVIRVGWQVRPDMYGDVKTHLFTYWTGDGYARSGGFDQRVWGFVVDRDRPITPGDVLTQVSSDIKEKYITLALYKKPGGWWLYYGEGAGEAKSAVGHWPDGLFGGLAEKATAVGWGGGVGYPPGYEGPPMGSGWRPSNGLDGSASFKNVRVSKGKLNDFSFGPVAPPMSSPYVTAAACYDFVQVPDETTDNNGVRFFFGGPSGCNLV